MRAALIVAPLLAVGCTEATSPGPAQVGCELVPDPYGTFEFSLGSEKARVVDGKGFVAASDGAPFKEIGVLYDPTFFKTNYAVDDKCVISRRDPSSDQRYEVRRSFSDGFEDAGHVRDLIGPAHGWTGFTLLSPEAPSVETYVDLRECILTKQCDFIDARLDVEEAETHSGTRALRATAAPKSPDLITSKASLESELVYFVEGDEVRFSAAFFLAEGRPFTLFDLESSWLDQGPGPRLAIDDDGALYVELKFGPKPTYRQARANKVSVPIGRWFVVEVRYVLKAFDEGVIEVRQDGELVLSASGWTLPLPNTILSSLEVGVTSTNYLDGETVVWVDDVQIEATR